jgi:hypothetical protein
MADRVRAHTRKTASGKTATVRSHGRKGRPRKALISPRHSWKLLRKAFAAGRKKKRAAAVVLGLLALTEITAWLTLEGASLIIATAGVLALAVGVAGAGLGGLHR